MRLNYFWKCGKLLIVIAVILSVNITGMAQSSTDLIAHFVEVIPGDDGVSYNINIFFSVLDSGNPINELKQENLVIQENGQKVEIRELRPLSEEPMNIVLVMDTSASMSETDITNAKNAATTFISRLKPNDQIALITYDTSAKNQVDELTNDHQKIIDIIINKINGTRDAGTCLFDAAYSALNMFGSSPTGSRAVILLTNGRDETATGAKCSNHTAAEVLTTASEGGLRAPLYVIGLDEDEKSEDGKKSHKILLDFAGQSGGLYIKLSNSSKLANTFDSLSTQFRAQYILSYTSTLLPGAHNVIVSLNTPNQPTPLDSDTRKFSLLPLPPHISFTSPVEGDAVSDMLKIAVTLTTQGETIVERVAFEVNGIQEGEDEIKPYEIEVDAKKYPAGQMTISATAYGANNTELARGSVNIIHTIVIPATNTPTEENTLPVEMTPNPTPTPSGDNSVVYMAIVLSGLSIVAIGVLLFFLLRQQKQATIRDLEKYVEIENTPASVPETPIYRKVEANRQAPQARLESDALGALVIEFSDDPTLVGHRFEITAPLVTLGRSADNDLNFPNDKPVSRHHAEIYQISGKLYLREVQTADATGSASPPKYGTLINSIPLSSDPVQLKTGDEIQLGKRVRLKFESYSKDLESDALTYDEEDDSDRTAADDDLDKTSIQDE